MKKIVLSLLLLVALDAAAQQNNNYSPIETILTDLNNDGKTDSISVYLPPIEGDPGTFRKINISLGSKGRNTFTAEDVWDKIDNAFAEKNSNTVRSNLAFVYKEPQQSFILLFGFAYGSGRSEISLIRIKDNKIEMLLDNTLEEPVRFTDLNNDGAAELVCRHPPEIYTTDEKTQTQTGSYSPFLVYILSRDMYLDPKLTEQYNKSNYVWAGYKYDENIKVRYPKKGKPEIIK
ncbi:hypothetical protein ACX0HA_16830 [Flavobacterium hauense]